MLGVDLHRADRGDDGLLGERARPIKRCRFRKAVAVRPASATAHNNLAVSLLEEENVDEAIREFRQSLALDPAYQNARYNLARAQA